jgi:hypothetical protein
MGTKIENTANLRVKCKNVKCKYMAKRNNIYCGRHISLSEKNAKNGRT